MTKRAMCGRCCRPIKVCFCPLIRVMHCNTEVIIWQHPSEQAHPKGTAQLLHLCLANSKIVCAERASPKELGLNSSSCVLLYPSDSSSPALSINNTQSVKQVLVLDGTWRKSRKIMYLNPWLQELPRMSIAGESGAYDIRKAESPHQLSTFESAVCALKSMHSETQFTVLDEAFEQFVAMYQSHIPSWG